MLMGGVMGILQSHGANSEEGERERRKNDRSRDIQERTAYSG